MLESGFDNVNIFQMHIEDTRSENLAIVSRTNDRESGTEVGHEIRDTLRPRR